MQPEVEILSGLERRIDVAISKADVEKEVQEQLKRVARTANIQGFRPGKAPLSVVERSHGEGIRYEAINNELGKALDSAIEASGLRVAGSPSIEGKEDAPEDAMVFSATFEVYPEITLPDLADLEITRSNIHVGDDEVQRTIDILRQQRATYEASEGRAAQADDRVTLDFTGTIEGVAFEGGSAEDFDFVLGQGRMLPEFEEAATGLKAGEEKVFTLDFPEDYGGEEVAGKTAEFTIKIKEVAEPQLPELNDEFAKELGQAEGDIDALLADVRANIEREAKARVDARTKGSVMDALLDATEFDAPKALVSNEIQNRITMARQELKERGMPNADDMPIPEDVFQDEAERRVRLGLLLAELVEQADLKATEDQVKARIEEFAQNYEQPEQVISYYLSDAQRRAEIEAIVLEDNVVAHVVDAAKVTDEDVDFEQLMGNN